MAYDEIEHEHLTSLSVRREAFLIYEGLRGILDAPVVRDETSVMAALCNAFLAAADFCEVDPEAAFAQIADAIRGDQMRLNDDPAQGRWVFPETTISH